MDLDTTIRGKLYAPDSAEHSVPADALRLTQGPIDALRLPKAGTASHAVVFFHGNKGNVTWCTARMRALASQYPTSHVWAFEYVGYGRLAATAPNTERLVLGAYQFLSAKVISQSIREARIGAACGESNPSRWCHKPV